MTSGEKAFLECKVCQNAKNAIGPMLNGRFCRKAGAVEGYSNSEANKDSGINWDEATFHECIKDPKPKVPGMNMIYPGLRTTSASTI